MIHKILTLFTPRERRRFYVLLGLTAVASVLEVVGISSIFPFVEVLSEPDLLTSDTIAGRLYRWSGIEQPDQFLIVLIGGVLVLVFASNAFLILTKTLVARFTWRRNYSIARKLVHKYLQAPYSYFVTHNSADLSKNILTEVGIFINGLLVPLMDIFAKGFTIILILALLVAMDPIVAISVAVTLGGFYLAVLWFVQGRLRRMGQQRIHANTLLFTSVSHAFGGIKEIKVLGREDVFVRNFAGPALEYAKLNTRLTVLSIVPRHVLEVIAYTAIVAVLIYLLGGGQNPGEALPLLALYAMAGFRLMPYFQVIYTGIAKVRFNLSALDQLYEDYSERVDVPFHPDAASPDELISFKESVELRDVHFTYSDTPEDVLRELKLRIRRGTMIGLAGESGSGKTTTVDIILGLLVPQRGGLYVDGQAIDAEAVRSWQKRVGYVPQEIYLIDGSIKENIALGVEPSDIALERIEHVARIAMLHDFVVTLPDGYDTVVAERGVRLSGGQRQRIGISRALYHEPDLLILDEATNALDGATERRVIDAIGAMEQPSTVVIISHRLSALRDCDEIHLFEEGRIIRTGRYEVLIEECSSFRAMSHASA